MKSSDEIYRQGKGKIESGSVTAAGTCRVFHIETEQQITGCDNNSKILCIKYIKTVQNV